ncbi:MAG TPA: helix-turn-helix domain-containing protein [Acidimicrobiales bacterium]|nr:helix-turn-helix domain-containing protein [Acidimicrobiales bacterium]
MLGQLYEGEDCSAARALELVGERWSLLILRDALFRHSTRFAEFQRSLRIAPNILAKRLDGFVSAGILDKRPRLGRTDQHDYVLTEMGMSLKPVVMALTAWGDRWIGPGPVVFTHAECGGLVDQVVRCGSCDRDAAPSAIAATVREDRHRRQSSGVGIAGGGGSRPRAARRRR